MARTMIRSVAAACAAMVGMAAVAVAPPAQAMLPYDECMASTDGVQTWGCYDLYVVPSKSPAASVEMKWTLRTDADGFNNNDWKGGFVMHRWPVEGQWKKYPPLGRVDLPDSSKDCVGGKFSTSSCYGLFNGPNGTLTIDFTPKMARYVYEVYSEDYICSAGQVDSVDPTGCGPSGGAVDRYVFVYKAVQYKNLKGRSVKAFKCPSREQRKSACVPAAVAEIAATIGGGDPVPPPSRN